MFVSYSHVPPRALHSFPTRRSSDLHYYGGVFTLYNLTYTLRTSLGGPADLKQAEDRFADARQKLLADRSEEHTSELQSRFDLVCRLLLEKKKKQESRQQTCEDSGTH